MSAARLWSDSPRWARRLAAALPLVLITGFSLALLWPVPAGRMPLSADHTVHLTRIWMFAEQLAQGRVRGWDPTWFFGTPVGELYPVLGDLVIVSIRALSLGGLDWSQAYAVGFTLVFSAQGWALLRVGRALGLGPVPGLAAALLVLADVGAYREGGWLYTVVYGVWPQALATALTWLALAELAVACEAEDSTLRRRRVLTGALAMGAALLAHPMALLSLALGGPLLVLTLGMRSRASLERTAAVAGLGAALGLALAAWWLVPMLQHRAWMASYGWMWQSLSRMAALAAEGRWAQSMPAAVGTTVSVGLLLLVVFGSRPARFFAAFALVQWLLASRDALWTLRLDQLSEGFTHIQYQRFITAAKPGLFVAAGAGLALALRGAAVAWRRPQPWGKPIAASLVLLVLADVGWMVQGQREIAAKHEVGAIELTRARGQPELDDEYAQLVAWMHQAWAEHRVPYRATVKASRNLHWFMDAPVFTGMPLYKQGFTPGDNFVHKPEDGAKTLLDRLRVRYVITRGRRGVRGREVARFGKIRVLERPGWESLPVAWLEGPGTLEVLEDDVRGGVVRARLSGADEGTRVVFGVAGYPRWTLSRDGEEIPWLEVPVVGEAQGVTPQQRRAGRLRGGKAHGDDGSEPTLIAADTGDGELELRYHPRRGLDLVAGFVSLLALALCGALAWRPQRWTAPTRRLDAAVRRLRRLGHPLVIGALAVAAVAWSVVKRSRAQAQEDMQAVGWVEAGRARVEPHARAGMLKADMLIRPAVLVDPRRGGPAEVVFGRVTLGEALTGWIALDDDAAKVRSRGRHKVRVEAARADGSVAELGSFRLPHRPGRKALDLDTAALAGQRVDLRVIVESEGESPPPLGFDLELGGPR